MSYENYEFDNALNTGKSVLYLRLQPPAGSNVTSSLKSCSAFCRTFFLFRFFATVASLLSNKSNGLFELAVFEGFVKLDSQWWTHLSGVGKYYQIVFGEGIFRIDD